MISRKPAGRSLRKRLALAYAAGIYAAGVFVLVLVVVPLASIDAAVPKGRPSPSTVTETGPGIGLPRLLMGSSVALVILIPVALALGWYVAGRFLQPLRAITATANVISAGDLHRRLDLGEPTDELTELGITQSVPTFAHVDVPQSPLTGYYPLPPWAGLAVACGYAAITLAAASVRRTT